MGLAMETARTEFLEQRQRRLDFPTGQSDQADFSQDHLRLQELLISGRIEERVEQLLQDLLPDCASAQIDGHSFISGHFEQFELLEQIGQGAFSRVFKAIDKNLGNRLVVLKTGRLIEQEPSIVGRLNHKHIIPVYSSWIDELGMTTICMPYLGRYTLQDKLIELRHRLRSERQCGMMNFDATVPWKRQSDYPNLIRILYEVCQALEYAHGQDVLHLDIKPSNVLIGFCGHALLLDFNLAGDILLNKSPTGGTLSYMSPEHLRRCVLHQSNELDVRSDIYSLGVLMFEMFYGFRPFESAGPAMRSRFQAKVMLQRQKRFRTLFETRSPGIPRALKRIIHGCLQFEPENRYASLTDLKQDFFKLGRRFGFEE